MTSALVGLAALALTGCGAGGVRFELRGFQTKSSETEYATNFTREGTVIALGNDRAAKEPYIVVFQVKHISGGDPDTQSQRLDPYYTLVVVNNGVGDYREYAGSRSKKTSYSAGQSWEQEKVDVRPIGFAQLHEIR